MDKKQQYEEVERLVRALKIDMCSKNFERLFELLKAPTLACYAKWKECIPLCDFFSIARESLLSCIETYDIQYKTFFPRYSRNLFFFVNIYYNKNIIKHTRKEGKKGLLYEYVPIHDNVQEQIEGIEDENSEPTDAEILRYFMSLYKPSYAKTARDLGISKEKVKKICKIKKVELTNYKNIREYIHKKRKEMGIKIPVGERHNTYNDYMRGYMRKRRRRS
jgi:hypothetical protein